MLSHLSANIYFFFWGHLCYLRYFIPQAPEVVYTTTAYVFPLLKACQDAPDSTSHASSSSWEPRKSHTYRCGEGCAEQAQAQTDKGCLHLGLFLQVQSEALLQFVFLGLVVLNNPG